MRALLPLHLSRCGGLLGLISGLTFVATVARADDLVAVLSFADNNYLQQRRADGGKKPQSYVFMQGSFHEGTTRDNTLEKMPFSDVVRRLAPDLAKQSFYPAKKIEDADLLLVVHWGVTSRKQSTDEMLAHTGSEHQEMVTTYKNAAQASADAAANGGVSYSEAIGLQDAEQRAKSDLDFDLLETAHEQSDSSMSQASNARLLGLNDELKRENDKLWSTTEGDTLRAMLDEERYFIVVVAYDCAAMLKDKKLTRLWSTKLNIRSPGVNFFIALNRMSTIGGMFYGSTMERLEIEPAKERHADVQIGDLIVIEQAPKR